MRRGGLSRLAAWHLPGGPVGLPASWTNTSNVEVGHSERQSHKEEERKVGIGTGEG